MKSIKVGDLREGMRFTKPVYVEGDNLLIPPAVPLKQREIERLKRWEIVEVQTEGEPMPETDEDSQQTGVAEGLDGGRARDPLVVYRASLKALDDFFRVVKGGKAVSRQPVDQIAQALVASVRAQPNACVRLVVGGVDTAEVQRTRAVSSVNGTMLAIVTGINLGLEPTELQRLAYASLLRDVGMLSVPDAVLEKKESLSEPERNQIRAHPVHSYRYVAKILKYPEEVALVVLQHHERWDGSGYPRRLNGDQIDLKARIVAVCDSYEAMVSSRPYRNSVIGYAAMRTLLGDNGRKFDPQVLKAFLSGMGIYPLGSIVQLNDNSFGQVVATSAEAPLRPTIKLLVDQNGKRAGDSAPVDLLVQKQLFIIRALDPKDLGSLPHEPS